MPEGPEVKYVTNFLNKKVKNKILNDITINSGRYQKHGPPKGFDNFVKELPLKIKSVNCHGKFMWWEFENSSTTLWNTLGMSGWWNNESKKKHNNLTFYLNNGEVFFNDMRNFGTFIFCNKDNLKTKLKKFGPDILEHDETGKNFQLFLDRIEKKRNDTFIASALLDQNIAAGCGNYIRAEVLYLAKISPFRKLEDLSKKELETIWNLLQQIAYAYYDKKLGIELGIIDGKYKFGNSYKKAFLIYRQTIDVHGNKVIREKIKDRSIHYVPQIQK